MSGRKRCLVYGVGVNDWCDKVTIGGKSIYEYILWQGMLERCYSQRLKSIHKTYQDVTCSDEWLSMMSVR